MIDFVIALSIGIFAGVIDVVPMIIKKMDKYMCDSALIHWIVLGLIIPFVSWEIQPWLKGLLIGELTAIPIMILVYPQDSKALIPMTVFSAILGIGVGLAGSVFIG
jgi:hypothetical protein